MTARLRALCALIEPCDSFIDVGCDHGFVVRYAVQNAIAKRITACDVSQPSLEKTKRLLGDGADVTYICADGATAAAGHSTVFMAGMGGPVMLSVMDGCAPDTFILSPQSHVDRVRKRLLDDDYAVVYDKTVRDGGKFYDAIKAKRGGGRAQRENASDLPLRLRFGMFMHEPCAALTARLQAMQTALASYPPTAENERKLREVEEALRWQRR